MISLQNLSYSGEVKLHDISFEIEEKDVVALLCEDECETTALLKCLALINPISGGSITLDDTDTKADKRTTRQLRQKIGMVLGADTLLPYMSVAENTMFALRRIQKMSRYSAFQQSAKYLRRFGLQDKLNSLPSELSTSEKVRAAVARTLAVSPSYLLLDNLLRGLPLAAATEVADVLYYLVDGGRTIVFATDNIQLAQEVATKVVVLKDGTVLEAGTPAEIFLSPKKAETKIFVQQLRTFEFSINDTNVDIFKFNLELTTFCRAHLIEEKSMNLIGDIFSELYLSNIYYSIPRSDFNTHITVEYSITTKSCDLFISYRSPEYDPFSVIKPSDLSNNSLARVLVGGIYSYEDGVNLVKFHI